MNITDIYPIYSRIWKASNFETKEKLVEVNWTFRDMGTNDHIFKGRVRLDPLLKAIPTPKLKRLKYLYGELEILYETKYSDWTIFYHYTAQYLQMEQATCLVELQGRLTVDEVKDLYPQYLRQNHLFHKLVQQMFPTWNISETYPPDDFEKRMLYQDKCLQV